MVLKGDKIWCVRDDNFVYVYTCEKYAIEEYNKLLKYYKSHKEPTPNDTRIYKVWLEADNYACIAIQYAGETKEVSLSISEEKVIR